MIFFGAYHNANFIVLHAKISLVKNILVRISEKTKKNVSSIILDDMNWAAVFLAFCPIQHAPGNQMICENVTLEMVFKKGSDVENARLLTSKKCIVHSALNKANIMLFKWGKCLRKNLRSNKSNKKDQLWNEPLMGLRVLKSAKFEIAASIFTSRKN